MIAFLNDSAKLFPLSQWSLLQVSCIKNTNRFLLFILNSKSLELALFCHRYLFDFPGPERGYGASIELFYRHYYWLEVALGCPFIELCYRYCLHLPVLVRKDWVVGLDYLIYYLCSYRNPAYHIDHHPRMFAVRYWSLGNAPAISSYFQFHHEHVSISFEANLFRK